MSESDIESELLCAFMNLSVENNTNDDTYTTNNMNAQQIQELVRSAVEGALAAQSALFDRKVNEATNRTHITAPAVRVYAPVTIDPTVECNEGLDVVKSLPEFVGDKDHYVSWRQAAHTAYQLFANFNGSSKHYQAVAIIRNKIKGLADGTLTSFSTPLNFHAIIARLDFCYADKRPIHLIEQEMSTLRQGKLSVAEYYDEVEKKLTLITNKTVMTYDRSIAEALNEKYRQDALRVFISGLKLSLSDTLFAARPSDLPSALALAEELEGSRLRYSFAASFANAKSGDHEEKKGDSNRHKPANPNYAPYPPQHAQHPQFYRQQAPYAPSGHPQPMDIDPSLSRLHQGNNNNGANNNHFAKRPFSGVDRQTDKNRQKVNFLAGTNGVDDVEGYHRVAEQVLSEDVADDGAPDNLNFLEESPYYPM